MGWNSSPTKYFSDNPMTSITDGVVMFCIAATLIIFDALLTLISIFKKGILIDQKSLLMQKTNKELKAMLVGVKKISNLKKSELVELVLTAS
tara:strand:- start:676 stop:951 length:276 start_codon:yes stop_codon:yes gene_type:complete